MVKQSRQLTQEAREHRAFVRHDNGWDVVFVQQHRQVVAPLGHQAHAHRHPALRDLVFGQQAKTQVRRLDRSGIAADGILVG